MEDCPTKCTLSLYLSIHLCFVGLFFTSVAVYLLHLFTILRSSLPAYFSNHISSSKEHIFVGFNKLPSLGALSSIITRHRGLFFFKEMGFYVCAQTWDLLF